MTFRQTLKNRTNTIGKAALRVVLTLFIHVQAFAQMTLSEDARISIITIGPYQPELWSSWGHSLIRIKDPNQNIDWAYDFGRFSFDQKNFYWNYALGKTYYSMGKFNDYPRLRRYFTSLNRSVDEQILNLNPPEMQTALDALEENNKPENREYLYNYVYDNCATRLVDIVDSAVSGRVIYDSAIVRQGVSIRDLMDEGLANQPWGDLLIDLLLGLQIDKEAELREYLMMPEYVMQAFAGAVIYRNSIAAPLVRETIVVHEPAEMPEAHRFLTPFNTFVLLFFVVGFITNRDFKTRKRTRWVDVLLFTLTGLLGFICIFLWFGTAHLSKYNYNLLWAVPLHLPAVWLLGVARFRPFLTRYFRFTAVWYALILIFWSFFPQDLHQSLIPFILTLILRSFYISYDIKRTDFSLIDISPRQR